MDSLAAGQGREGNKTKTLGMHKMDIKNAQNNPAKLSCAFDSLIPRQKIVRRNQVDKSKGSSGSIPIEV